MKTTKKEFEVFEKACRKYIEFWGLYNWDIYIDKQKLDGTIAETWFKTSTNTATIWLNENQDSIYDMKETACHEVCHIVIADLEYCGRSRFQDEDAFYKCSETLTKLISNKIYPLIK